MTKQGWIAIFLAVTFPSTAMLVILLMGSKERGAPKPPLPRCHERQLAIHPAGGVQGPCFGPHMKMPPHGDHHGKPRGDHHGAGPRMEGDNGKLKIMAKELGLTKEQIDKIIKIESDADKKMEKAQKLVTEKEQELFKLMNNEKTGKMEFNKLIDELVGLKGSVDKLHLLVPIEIREVLTDEQRKKIHEIMSKKPPVGPGMGGEFGPKNFPGRHHPGMGPHDRGHHHGGGMIPPHHGSDMGPHKGAHGLAPDQIMPHRHHDPTNFRKPQQEIIK
ncbi:MAG: hypothetical protein JXR95_12245 [Deltaproteobacteria bacterium]|nr:hypothetical protein [Deltaproteobacteria bacterium]